MTQVDRIRAVCSLLPPDPFARPPLASTNLTPPLPSPQAATDGHPRLERRQRLNGRRRPSCVCFRLRGAPPGVCSGLGAGGGLSFADCWALCVELGLVREPHQSGRAARRRWGREKAVGDGGGPHSSI